MKQIISVLIVTASICSTFCLASIQYDYDTQHRLIRVVYEDGTTIEYEYDASGNRTRRVSTILADPVLDGQVDFRDLAVFASHWLEQNCTGPDWCGGADVDHSTEVNWGDVAILTQQWLACINP